MNKYERLISVIMLFVISVSNVATPVAYAAPMVKVHVPAFAVPKKTTFMPSGPITAVGKVLHQDQGSVLGATTSLLNIGTQELDLRQSTANSAQKRIPIQVQQFEKKVYRTDENVTFAVTNPDNDVFTTSVHDAKGNTLSVPVTESNTGSTTTVDLVPSNTIKPGLYKVTVTDSSNHSTEQDFTWGVLALNPDKSMYHPGDKADIAMAVLNDNGDMVCDARVSLEIQNSDGTGTELSTEGTGDNKITVSDQCQKHDYSLEPDYEGHYTFPAAGLYTLTLTANTGSGTHTIIDTIQVKDAIPFDVQRVSATRIYPPNTYPMIFTITANQDFNGTVTETVPDSFTITPSTQSATQSYSDLQTVYLNSNDPAALMSQNIASSSGGLSMPFHGSYPITQGFGAQLTDPTLQAFYTHYGLGGHDGIDFGVPMNTPLYAVDEGDIIWSGPGDYGTMVTIQHAWGKTYYGHMTNTSVTVGQHVTKGQLIGYSGMSGEATGPHLHFGMKPNNPDMTNGYYGKIDPMPFLPIGQGEPIAALGASANPVDNLVYNTTVLGASDSAATPTPSDAPSPTPTATPTAVPTSSPTPTPTADNTASDSAAISATPTPTPESSATVSTPTNTDSNFTVLDQEIKLNEQIANNALTDKVKVLTWKVHLKKGETTNLGYAYQAPKVSPQFYLLGPAKFYAGGNERVVFQEDRQWQIASDDIGTEWYQNTGGPHNWNGYSWQYRKKLDISSSLVNASASASVVISQTPTFMDSGGDATNTNGGTNFCTTTCTGANAGGFWGSVDNTSPASLTTDCTFSHTGSCSYKAVNSTTNKADLATPDVLTGNTTGRVSTWFYFDNMTTNAQPLINIQSSGNSNAASIEIDGTANNILKIVNLGSGTTSLQSGKWYRISVAWSITSTSVHHITVYLNGKQEIDEVNAGTLNTASVAHYRIGNIDNQDTSTTLHFDDIYADNGSDLSDPGDVRVTNKRPFSNGNSNLFATQIGSGGSGYGSGHAPQVNELPLNTANGWSSTSNSIVENYTLESQSTGDVNIPTNAGLIADEAWIFESNAGACGLTSSAIVNSGVNTTIATSATNTIYTNIAKINTYPSGNQAVGVRTCGTGTNISLYEAGMQIAYVDSLNNFPVMVNVSGDADLAAHAQANAADVVFTDSTGRNLLPFEIERASSTNLIAWVQIPALSSKTDTIIYMYYGNPSATSQAAATSVWDSNYKGVWHAGITTPTGTLTGGALTSLRSQSVSAALFPYSVAFSSDGSKMYISSGSTDQKIFEYPLSTPWDVSTAGSTTNFSISTWDTQPYCVTFSPDGKRMFMLGNSSKKVYDFPLSTAWDVTTAGTPTSFASNGNGNTTPYTIRLSPDGNKLYILGNAGDKIYEYNLVGPWDLSSSPTFYGTSPALSQDTNPLDFYFNPAGTKMYMLGGTGASNKTFYQYTLSTAWDVTTATYASVTSTESSDLSPGGFVLNSDGSDILMLGGNNKTVYDFQFGTSLSASDSTSNANTGTVTGAISTPGEIATGVNFNGQTQVINAGSGSSLDDITSGLTIDTWIYPTIGTGTGARAILDKSDDISTFIDGWGFYYGGASQDLAFTASYSGASDLERDSATSVISLNTWQHVVVTWDGSTSHSNIHIYINGAETTYGGTQTDGAGSYDSDAAENLLMGSWKGQASGDNFVGNIDEVRISNTVRTPGWVKTEYNNVNSSTFVTVGSSIESDINAPTLDKIMRHGEFFDSTGSLQPFVF